MNQMNRHWIFNRRLDLSLLLLPVWLCWLVFFLLPKRWVNIDLPLWTWVVFILGLDVSHVWSTLFRTYLDPAEFSQHKKTLCLTPVLVLMVCFGIALFLRDWFWRALSYFAVFHFVKQQYGFMILYKAKAGDFTPKSLSDSSIIYLATLYPMVFWHLSPDRNFSWFIENDFFRLSDMVSDMQWILDICNLLYWLLILAWVRQEFLIYRKNRSNASIGKILWVLTTAANWYLGIVFFNSDLVFSISNVVAHGVPYLVLINWYVIRKKRILATGEKPYTFRWRWIGWIFGGSLFLAFIEEYGWDVLINREKQAFFTIFLPYTLSLTAIPTIQAAVLSVLILPQVTHYVIDGGIWKNNEKNPHLNQILSIDRS